MNDFPYRYSWGPRLLGFDRKGQFCRVIVRGGMNSAWVEFEDGFQAIVSRNELNREPCECVTCGECGGSGQVEYRTGSYPERDLESCSNCRGNGITETCDRCQLMEERENES